MKTIVAKYEAEDAETSGSNEWRRGSIEIHNYSRNGPMEIFHQVDHPRQDRGRGFHGTMSVEVEEWMEEVVEEVEVTPTQEELEDLRD